METISSISDDIKQINNRKNIFMNWIFLFYFFSNFLFTKCDDFICKNNNNIENTKCFNHLIIMPKTYRSGHFVTTTNGELIIEYSEDTLPGGGRLFYRLKPDGRGYYPGDYPIKQIEITETYQTKNEKNEDITCSGRYEARNIIINLEEDETKKEYLFSTSSWYSFTELYDLESHENKTWFTSNFFDMEKNDANKDKYIYSYIYSLLNEPGTTNYFLVYIQYLKDNAMSDRYVIKKFSFKLEEGAINQMINASIYNTNNQDNRVISAILMEKIEKLVVYFLKNKGPKLYVKSYTYNLVEDKEKEVDDNNFILLEGSDGTGNFFEGVYLSDIYTAIFYFPNKDAKNKLCFKLYNYLSSSGFNELIYKEVNKYDLDVYMYNSAIYKINDNRVIFTCVN